MDQAPTKRLNGKLRLVPPPSRAPVTSREQIDELRGEAFRYAAQELGPAAVTRRNMNTPGGKSP